MWKNVEADRPQTTVWRMRTACWIPEDTHTYSAYAILIALHRISGYTHEHECNIICRLPVLYVDSKKITFLPHRKYFIMVAREAC
jgi:hypothetical protein